MSPGLPRRAFSGAFEFIPKLTNEAAHTRKIAHTECVGVRVVFQLRRDLTPDITHLFFSGRFAGNSYLPPYFFVEFLFVPSN